MLKRIFNAEYAEHAEGTEYPGDAAEFIALCHFEGVK